MAAAADMIKNLQEISSTEENLDINRPLTDDELRQFGMLTDTQPVKVEPSVATPVFKDLDDVDDAPVDAVLAFVDANSYNARYAHYLRCQAIAALVAFDDGWKSFENLALLSYVKERRRENSEYQGHDPNLVFSLRIRQQTAEDFVRFIRSVIVEAVSTPKPTLEQK